MKYKQIEQIKRHSGSSGFFPISTLFSYRWQHCIVSVGSTVSFPIATLHCFPMATPHSSLSASLMGNVQAVAEKFVIKYESTALVDFLCCFYKNQLSTMIQQ